MLVKFALCMLLRFQINIYIVFATNRMNNNIMRFLFGADNQMENVRVKAYYRRFINAIIVKPSFLNIDFK